MAKSLVICSLLIFLFLLFSLYSSPTIQAVQVRPIPSARYRLSQLASPQSHLRAPMGFLTNELIRALFISRDRRKPRLLWYRRFYIMQMLTVAKRRSINYCSY